jgi:hypothetical protein
MTMAEAGLGDAKGKDEGGSQAAGAQGTDHGKNLRG